MSDSRKIRVTRERFRDDVNAIHLLYFLFSLNQMSQQSIRERDVLLTTTWQALEMTIWLFLSFSSRPE